MKKKLLIVFSVVLALIAIMSLTVFAQNADDANAENGESTGENVNDEMPPMKLRIDGKAFLESLALMGRGMLGIFIVTLVIIGVVAVLNWHGKSMAERNAKK